MVGKPEAELRSAVDGLVAAGLLFRQGVSTQVSYLFKHALIQDAAYSTLLREPRRALHTRIADTLERDFADIADSQPEISGASLHRGWIDRKGCWTVGQGWTAVLARSALVEAIEQVTRALAQIASMPASPALRREQIKLQVALITPVIHVKGYAAPETKAAAERARLLIEQAEALGEPPEDPLLLFSVLYGYWAVNYVAFNGDMMRKLAQEFLAFAETQGTTVPLLVGRRLMGASLLLTGEIAEGRASSRSGDRTLRSYPASSADDAIWSRCQGVYLILSVVGPVLPWLSRMAHSETRMLHSRTRGR